jgi:hypothetical protein
MILLTRWGSPGLNGRRRTRDWSGLRIVAVRLTCIDMGASLTVSATCGHSGMLSEFSNTAVFQCRSICTFQGDLFGEFHHYSS